MEVYFVRHGETDENKKGINLGSKMDVPLNQWGIEQAREIQLPSGFDLIFTSPMKRCLQTAEIINKKLKVKIIVRPELTERGKGVLEGKNDTETAEYTNNALNTDFFARNLEVDYSPYGGESIEQVRQRLKIFTKDLLRDYPDKKILVCTHMGIMKVLNALYSKQSAENFSNAVLQTLEISN